jgi:hypothetical protein
MRSESILKQEIFMRAHPIQRLAFISLALLLLLAGCSSQVAKEENYGGFLDNYKQLTEMESSDGVMILGWRKPGVDLGSYHSIIIEPVVLSPKADIGERIETDELDTMRASLRQKMIAQISQVMNVTDKAGPGVITYSLALAGAEAVDRDLRWFEYTPITFTASQIAAASGNRENVVELWVEARWSDSDTGEILAAVVRMGQSAEGVDADEAVDAAHVDTMLDEWAAASRVSLQQLEP